MDAMNNSGRGGRRHGIAAIALSGAGTLLLVWTIRAAGAAAVLQGIRRLGPGFIVVCALGGVRGILRTMAWRLCLDDASLLTFRRAFSATLAGGALGNLTPFGWLISEPSKIVLVKDQLAASASIAVLAVENLFYIVSVALMLTTGTVLLSFAAPLPPAASRVSLAVLALVSARRLASPGSCGGDAGSSAAQRVATAPARHGCAKSRIACSSSPSGIRIG